MSNNWLESYETFKKAFAKLKEFIETDNNSEKDRSAIINAFQYTLLIYLVNLYKNMIKNYNYNFLLEFK